MKATAALGVAILFTRATNFITQMVIAHRLGTGNEADAYFVVENIMLLLGSFVIAGFAVAYIPIWTDYNTRNGEEEAVRFKDAFVSFTVGSTLLLAVLCFFGARFLIWLTAPGFTEYTTEIAVSLLKTMTPAVALLGLAAGCTAILQSRQRFVIPEFSFLAYNLALLTAATLTGSMGIRALAWGTVLGACLRVIIQLPATHKLGGLRFTRYINHEGVREVRKRVLPIFLAYAGTSATILMGNVVASGLSEGAVGSLVYASRVVLLPVGLFILPLQTTILPTLSQQVAGNQMKTMGDLAIKGFCLLALITIPVTAGLIMLKIPLIQLFYQRGAFGAQAALSTAHVLGWYSLALPATGGLMLINSIYSSLGEPITLVKFNLFNWVTTLGLSFGFAKVLGPNGIALGISLSVTLTFALAMWIIKRRLPALNLRLLGVSALKALLATVVMTVFLKLMELMLVQVLNNSIITPTTYSLLVICSFALVGGVVYGITTFILQVEEVRALYSIVSMRIRRRGLTK